MAWTDFILSTTTSIARHQSNINQLSPVSSSYEYYYSCSGEHLFVTEVSIQLAGLCFIDSDGNQTVIPSNLLPYVLATGSNLEKVVVTDLSDYSSYTFQGYNAKNTDNRWVDTTNTNTLSLEGAKFISSSILVSNGWQAKIDLAKQKLGQDLLVQFRSQGIVDQYNPLDLITNPIQLTITSDYLSLALIYTQLALQGLNQIYVNKRNWYWKQYQLSLHNVGSVIQLSYNRITNHVGRLQI